MINKALCGDCLALLSEIEDSSVDMVLCDLPYGTTQSKRDTEIDLDLLWNQYLRVCKENAAIVVNSIVLISLLFAYMETKADEGG